MSKKNAREITYIPLIYTEFLYCPRRVMLNIEYSSFSCCVLCQFLFIFIVCLLFNLLQYSLVIRLQLWLFYKLLSYNYKLFRIRRVTLRLCFLLVCLSQIGFQEKGNLCVYINWMYAAHPSFRWFPEKAWQIEAVPDQEVAEERGTLKRLQNATRR